MDQPVVQLFVNSAAGSASARRVRALRRALESGGARVIVTPTSVDVLTIADEASHACAVGGDGTLRHVGDAMARSGRSVAMGIYPAGTVNLLAREYGYERDAGRFAARLLAQGTLRLQRVARIGDVRMFTCASVGPDSRAVAAASPRAKRLIGRAVYALAFATVLIRWQRPRLKLTANGRTIACEAVYVAKGRYYAGPWSFAPAARADDPYLHVVALRRARRRDFLRFCLQMLGRADLDADANLIRLTCTALAITGEERLPLQADGDVVATLPIEIAIDPTAIAFL